MSSSYPKLVSHLVLAGVGVVCLQRYGLERFWYPQICFGLIIAYSLAGAFRYGSETYGDDIENPYYILNCLEEYLAQPCVFATMMDIYSHPMQLVYADLIISLVPVVTNRVDIKDAMAVTNPLLLGCLSAYHQNIYGLLAAITHVMGYISIRIRYEEPGNFKKQDFYNYLKCIFIVLALKIMSQRKEAI